MTFAARYGENIAIRVALFGLGLMLLGVLLSYAMHIFGVVTLWLLALSGLGIMAFGGAMLSDERPVVTLDERGLRDRRWSNQWLDWSRIAAFDPVTRFSMDMVEVLLDDPALMAPATLAGRLLRRVGAAPPGVMLISTAWLDCSAPALSEAILAVGTHHLDAAEAKAARLARLVAPSADDSEVV